MKNKIVIISLISLAILSRLFPHPPNFTPLVAAGMFGMAYFGSKIWSFLIPLLALYISNLVLDNTIYAKYHQGFVWFDVHSIWIYVALLGTSFLSYFRFKNSISNQIIFLTSLLSSLVFFAVSNFGVWIGSGMYAHTYEGFITCYVMAIPFLGNALAGDLFFNLLLFGTYIYFIKKKIIMAST